jgi:hypothetical protein
MSSVLTPRAPRPLNGSITAIERFTNVSSGSTSVMSTRCPASERRASRVSSPATPPPAMTTRRRARRERAVGSGFCRSLAMPGSSGVVARRSSVVEARRASSDASRSSTASEATCPPSFSQRSVARRSCGDTRPDRFINSQGSSVITSSMFVMAGVSHGVSNAYRRHRQARESAPGARRVGLTR